MLKKSLPGLALVIVLAGCGTAPERARTAGAHDFYWPDKEIKATLEYKTVQLPPSKTTCAGKLTVENFGRRNYTVLLFNVKVFNASGELIATDRFSLSSNLNPGGRAEIPFDPHNPLNPVVITRSYSECPRDMATIDVNVDAF